MELGNMNLMNLKIAERQDIYALDYEKDYYYEDYYEDYFKDNDEDY